jgi:exodeoxyribonuclease V alpha subunit
VAYDAQDLDELTLAYAISVHKAQGSEYPAVVLPLLSQHYIMLQRNLLYTAITRGRQLVVIVGSRRALGIALKNNRPKQRLSGLQQRLECLGDASASGSRARP